MNKKDVLGAHPAAGIIQKMKSMPHPIQCRKCSKYDTQQGKGKAWFLALYLLSDKVSTGANNS